MGKYVDSPIWENQILIVDRHTPVLGGIPYWSGEFLISGHYNIPVAQVADRTRYLLEVSNDRYNYWDLQTTVGDSMGAYSVKEEPPSANITLTDPEDSLVGYFHIPLNSPSVLININIPINPGRFRMIEVALVNVNGDSEVEWGENILWQASTPPVLSATAGETDVLRFMSDPSGSGKWYGVVESLGLRTTFDLITDGSWITDGSQITSGYKRQGGSYTPPPISPEDVEIPPGEPANLIVRWLPIKSEYTQDIPSFSVNGVHSFNRGQNMPAITSSFPDYPDVIGDFSFAMIPDEDGKYPYVEMGYFEIYLVDRDGVPLPKERQMEGYGSKALALGPPEWSRQGFDLIENKSGAERELEYEAGALLAGISVDEYVAQLESEQLHSGFTFIRGARLIRYGKFLEEGWEEFQPIPHIRTFYIIQDRFTRFVTIELKGEYSPPTPPPQGGIAFRSTVTTGSLTKTTESVSLPGENYTLTLDFDQGVVSTYIEIFLVDDDGEPLDRNSQEASLGEAIVDNNSAFVEANAFAGGEATWELYDMYINDFGFTLEGLSSLFLEEGNLLIPGGDTLTYGYSDLSMNSASPHTATVVVTKGEYERTFQIQFVGTPRTSNPEVEVSQMIVSALKKV